MKKLYQLTRPDMKRTRKTIEATRGLTMEQTAQQDAVDNAIYDLISGLCPAWEKVEWDMEIIGEIAENIADYFSRKGIMPEMEFYPYLPEVPPCDHDFISFGNDGPYGESERCRYCGEPKPLTTAEENKRHEEWLDSLEKVDVIAAGYEWSCTNCGEINREIEVRESFKCPKCKRHFSTNLPEHALG